MYRCLAQKLPLIRDTFQIELKLRSVGFPGEPGKTGVPGEKLVRARPRTNDKFNPHFEAESGT